MPLSSAGWANPSSATVVATIEARMTSSRLPGKVLAPVGGQPMLALMVERLRRAQTIEAICVATTTNKEDDPIVEVADDLGIGCFRGSEDDVLERVLLAARAQGADVIVETTGDCPFIDWGILDACVLAYFADDLHLTGNCLSETFPRGLDVRVFATDALEEVNRLTSDPIDHEHVSTYFYAEPGRYRVRNLQAVGRLRRPEWRWTVDTGLDLEFVRRVVDAIGTAFSAAEAVDFLQGRPDLIAINAGVVQKSVR